MVRFRTIGGLQQMPDHTAALASRCRSGSDNCDLRRNMPGRARHRGRGRSWNIPHNGRKRGVLFRCAEQAVHPGAIHVDRLARAIFHRDGARIGNGLHLGRRTPRMTGLSTPDPPRPVPDSGEAKQAPAGSVASKSTPRRRPDQWNKNHTENRAVVRKPAAAHNAVLKNDCLGASMVATPNPE